jgi:hypothetical protein
MTTMTRTVCDFCGRESSVTYAWSKILYSGYRGNCELVEVASSRPRDVCPACFEGLVNAVNAYRDKRQKDGDSISGF